MADTKTVKVELEEPLGKGDDAISTVTLQRPNAGQLRGLQIAQIMQMDAAAMITLLPRITQPPLTPAQVETELAAADFAELGGQVVGFFYTAKAKAALGIT